MDSYNRFIYLFRKSSMRCLETTRANQIKTFNDPFDENTDTRLPGEQYTLNQQCQLALGGGYKAYTSSKAPFQVYPI